MNSFEFGGGIFFGDISLGRNNILNVKDIEALSYNGYVPADASLISNVIAANKLLLLNSSGLLPTGITGNAASASKFETPRAINIAGDATATTNFDGSANVTLTLTLEDTITAGTYSKLTVDSKGRATAGAVLAAVDIPSLDWGKITTGKPTTLTGYGITDALNTAGGSLTNFLTLHANPTQAMHAVTKYYVDNLAAGIDVRQSCRAASTANIPALSGLILVDMYTAEVGARILVKNQTDPKQNGIYIASAGAWTRSTDFDDTSEVTSGCFTFVEGGSSQASTGWIVNALGAITIGTSNITFVQFSGAGTYIPGTGITMIGSSIGLSTIGTAGTFYSVTTDAYGRVTGGNVTLKIASGGSIFDGNGLKYLSFIGPASAANYLQLESAIAGNMPILKSAGTDAEIGFALSTKGGVGFRFYNTTNTSYLTINSATNTIVNIGAAGAETNIDLKLSPKGIGYVVSDNPLFGAAGEVPSFVARQNTTAGGFNYVLGANNDLGQQSLYIFTNGSTRVPDGGPNAVSIMNRIGSFNLGSGSFDTNVYGVTLNLFGVAKAVTPAADTNTTQLATTEFVQKSFARTDAMPVFSGGSANGAEGGKIFFKKPITTSLGGNIQVDVYSNTFRILEAGGTARGAYLDIATCAASCTSMIYHSGNLVPIRADAVSAQTIAGNLTITYPNALNVRHVNGAGASDLYLNWAQPAAQILCYSEGSSGKIFHEGVYGNEILLNTNLTLTAAHNHKRFIVTGGTIKTITVPAGLPVTFECVFVTDLSPGGGVTFANTANTAIYSGTNNTKRTSIVGVTSIYLSRYSGNESYYLVGGLKA